MGKTSLVQRGCHAVDIRRPSPTTAPAPGLVAALLSLSHALLQCEVWPPTLLALSPAIAHWTSQICLLTSDLPFSPWECLAHLFLLYLTLASGGNTVPSECLLPGPSATCVAHSEPLPRLASDWGCLHPDLIGTYVSLNPGITICPGS